jgi:polyisoprenoid-binding protein YceI
MKLSLPGLVALLAIAGFTFGDSTRVTDDVVTFSPDRSHSNVGFKVRHLGISNVRGSFRDYDATIQFNPEDLSTLSVRATVLTTSIDTRNERRDNHLRSDDFFNSEQYPELTFVSKEIRSLNGNQFEMVGDLTIRDVTKEVIFATEFMGVGAARRGMKAGFEARTTINRFDFGLKWDRLTEVGGLVVSEDVEILLEMELDEVIVEG